MVHARNHSLSLHAKKNHSCLLHFCWLCLLALTLSLSLFLSRTHALCLVRSPQYLSDHKKQIIYNSTRRIRLSFALVTLTRTRRLFHVYNTYIYVHINSRVLFKGLYVWSVTCINDATGGAEIEIARLEVPLSISLK